MPDTIAQTQKKSTDCQMFVGTSGYSYTEWIEAGFYPTGTQSSRMLPLYARHFAIAELNYTWYQMPKAEAIERQRRLVAPKFLFAAKLTRTLTHEIDAESWSAQVQAYRDGIAPLVQAGQLAAVLIQLPPSFARTSSNRSYLATLLDKLHGFPLAVEFRHRSWATDRVFAELERRRITLVSVDEPDLPGLFPALDVVTHAGLFYVRFHGRNAKGWRAGKMQLQFDYDYSDDELSRWIEEKVEPMSRQTQRGILFFNNHIRAQAPRNAERMAELLKDRGLTVV